MFGFEYPKNMPVGRICLEVSLKPFGLDMTDMGIEKTCREMFDGWRELIGHASAVAVLMWTSDGSEILEYSGDMESAFDWSRYIGIGNPREKLPDWDPEGNNLHSRPRLYIGNPPEMRYSDLKRIIAALKKVGKEMFGLDVEVGETFDPGPEFAYSDFKFHRHPEINRGKTMGQWIHCAGKLHADNYQYAAYPDGIPEGLYFGRFLGEQFMKLKEDVGFDFLWLSNGFGFSLDSWSWTGELFDGEKFDFSGAAEVRESIETFWREFTAATGDMRIETRGSNLSAGMDISAHGCPVDAIYKYPMVAPPNSPWAPLNFRYGLELAGYMSRIACLPEKGYLFRFYTHDPWWHNSPWFDRYDRTPQDIYLPLAIARMDEKGKVTPPIGMNLLTADDSYGWFPRRCPVECTPHMLDAYSHYPDEAGPVTWLYPFESYVQIGLKEGKMDEMFMDDWLIENAIDQGMPMNSVIADSVFMETDAALYKNKILVTPTPHAGTVAEKAVLKALEAGCRVLMYGSTGYASDEIRRLVGVKQEKAIDGELTIDTDVVKDTAPGEQPKKLRHCSLLSGGGVTEIADEAAGVEVVATVTDGAETRVYATVNAKAINGTLAWVRASFPHDETIKGSLPVQLNKDEYFPVACMLRGMLAPLGLGVSYHAEKRNTRLPVVHVSVCDNMMYFSEFALDSTIRMSLKHELGAPLLDNRECIVENDEATYPTVKFTHNRCWMFAKQKEKSLVGIRRYISFHPTADERYLVTGLKDATLTVKPPLGSRIGIVRDGTPQTPLHSNVDVKPLSDGTGYYVEHLTGDFLVGWQSDHNPGSMLREDQLKLIKITETKR